MTTYYISPSGSDLEDGENEGDAWKTFEHAISVMAGGDELILMDGTYSDAAQTGYLSWESTYGGDFPSGVSRAQMTYIHAQNPGSVIVDGGSNNGLWMGRSSTKLSYVKVQGITFKGGGNLYNTSYDVVKECGFDGGFGIGTNDHTNGNTYNLIEDVWVWADGHRIICINYNANSNAWRRIVVRGDGCGTAACEGSGNPNVGFTVYNSQDCSVQNMLLIDRILIGNDEPYGDFASAQHTPGDALGRNQWLGCASINGPDISYYFEADNVVGGGDPTFTVRNCLSINADSLGFNNNNMPLSPNIVENFTVINAGGAGIRLASGHTTSTVRNIISIENGGYGITSASTPSYADVYNNASGGYSQTICSTGCLTTNPQADGSPTSLLYVTRVESGSALDGIGYGGADYGAALVYRYGTDGTTVGDANYNTLTSSALWPWPNEARIKKEMGVDVGISRGFCTTSKQLNGVDVVTLTSYVWELLGNQMPADVYGEEEEGPVDRPVYSYDIGFRIT